MPLSIGRTGPWILVLIVACCEAAQSEEPLTFEQHVRPLLKTYCLDCHGAGDEVKGNLDLRLRRFVLKGGDSGPAMTAGKSAESLLVQRLRAGEMPPGEKKLTPAQVDLVARWIDSGAVARRQEPEALPAGIDITPEERSFWAFQPVRLTAPPAFGSEDRVRTPIDAWILAKLRPQGLSFNPDADKLTLLRRASFDLTGLPPSQAEIETFLADETNTAFERMIDRLLESPHYGERWARHWLDVVGYADSDGDGTTDTPRPYAWKYRDYVIRSFNDDKPLDRFLIEQLAGDELVPRPAANLTPEQIELLTATGFLRMGADQTAAGGDQALNANQAITDQIRIVSSSLLGLTVGCAQCHDHRYDPIPQSDYYRLRAVFEPAWNWAAWRGPASRLVSLMTDSQRAERTKVEEEEKQQAEVVRKKQQEWIDKLFEAELQKFPEDQRSALAEAFKAAADKRTPEQKKLVDANPKLNITAGVIYQYSQPAADEIKKLNEELDRIRARKPVEDFIHAMLEEPGVAIETKVFHRGDHRQPKQAVIPGDLTIAASEGARFEIAPKNPALPTTGRRLAYARRLVDGQHPLVGRVLVNRIWLHHFGRGLVDSPGDFGALGLRPSHPELLDWLAAELCRKESGEQNSGTATSPPSGSQSWSLKRLHRLIMTSTVYRQSSRRDPAKEAADPDNRLYGRAPVRRLDAEVLRDRILAASGQLDPALFGPAAPLKEDFVGQVVADSPRRSVYLQARRSRPVSFLAAFDAPLMTVNCDRRVTSTTAPQSLMLMNSEFVVSQAGALAQRVRRESPERAAKDSAGPGQVPAVVTMPAMPAMIACAWDLAYRRAISPEELAAASAFCTEQLAHLKSTGAAGDRELAVLTNLCQQLLDSNEFLYVD